jgi:Ca-activated chloride channel family protein
MDRLRRSLVWLVPYGLVALVGGGIGLVLFAEIQDLRGVDAIELHDKGALALLLASALVAWVGFHLHVRRSGTFSFSRVSDLARTRRGFVSWLTTFPRALRVVALALLAVALARPQTFTRQEIEVEGIDIMLVLDLSKSMEEGDLRPNRLYAAQRTIRRFLEGHRNDRIGLVVFAKEAMVQCPLTLDHDALDSIVSDLAIGDVEPMGTAIGDGLGLALANLRRSDARSKIIILLSDGDSNTVNEMDPDEATQVAKDGKVKVFTVLIGREEGALRDPDFGIDLFGRQPYAVNPALLRGIAASTGGRYFNAPDTRALDRGFEEVRATLEKSKHREVGKIYGELFPRFVTPALVLLLLEVLLSLTRFRKFP